ncbi:MAG: M20 family metallopeptidase [Gemmataceae bacterium]
MSRLDRLLSECLPDITAIRHDLHAHPQLGYQESYASELVQTKLREWGIPFTAGLAQTGVVGWLEPSEAAADMPAVGLRADLDALPIEEATALPYASTTPGVMHACGHDGHTSLLLGAAYILSKLRRKLPRPVKLVFQPAEENGAGAQRMVEAGALAERVGGRRVAAMFGLHGSPLIPVGVVASKPGPLLAGCCDFDIVVHGSGGHAALPHLAADPVVAASAMVTALQTVVSRNTDPIEPAVVSVCGIHGGEANNVIPDTVKLFGTIRSHYDSVFEKTQLRMLDLVQATARGYGCRAEVAFTPSYPPVHNDPAATELADLVAVKTVGPEAFMRLDRAYMASEDFAFYGRVVPSCFSFIGLIPTGLDSHPMLHTPQFDFTDAALETGIRLMCGYALAAHKLI